MVPASFRHEFFDVLKELSDLPVPKQADDVVTWHMQYLSRKSAWYHFDGWQDEQEGRAAGVLFDTLDGSHTPLPGSMLTLELLDFGANAFIGAYVGEKRIASHIASDISRGFDRPLEIVSVGIDRERILAGGSCERISTTFVFVGFERREHMFDVGSGKCLAASRDIISSYWCRNRTRNVSHPLN